MSSANPQSIDKDLAELVEHFDTFQLTVTKLESEMQKDSNSPWQDWPLLTEEAISVWWTTMEGEATDL